MFGSKIKEIRESKGIGVNKLSRISGISAGYISALERGEKQNPSQNTLNKLAAALDITLQDLINYETNKISSDDNNDPDIIFNNPSCAVKFILNQPSVMKYSGFDINKLTDTEVNDLTSEVLSHLKLLGFKYKR